MVLTSVFLFKRLLNILLYAGGEEVTPSSDTAATAEWKSLKQGKKRRIKEEFSLSGRGMK